MQQNNGLDKNQLISFVLFTLILMGGMFYFQNKQAKEQQLKDAENKAKATQTVQNSPTKPAIVTNLNDSVKTASIQQVELKNKDLTLAISTLGGQISTVQLNQYKAYNRTTDKNDKQLLLFDKNNSTYGFQFKDKTGKIFNTKDLVFSPVQNGNSVTMQANVNGAVIQFIYTLSDKYTVDFNVKTQGLSQLVSDQKADFVWDYNVREMEKGRSQEQTHTEFNYTFNNYKSFDYDGRTTMEEPDETLNWLAVKQQFFTALIEPKNGFKNSRGSQEMIEEGEYLKKFKHILDSRDKGLKKYEAWYAYGRRQGFVNISGTVVAIPGMVGGECLPYKINLDGMEFKKTCFVSGFIVTGRNSDELLSERFMAHLKVVGKPFSGGWVGVSKKDIEVFNV